MEHNPLPSLQAVHWICISAFAWASYFLLPEPAMAILAFQLCSVCAITSPMFSGIILVGCSQSFWGKSSLIKSSSLRRYTQVHKSFLIQFYLPAPLNTHSRNPVPHALIKPQLVHVGYFWQLLWGTDRITPPGLCCDCSNCRPTASRWGEGRSWGGYMMLCWKTLNCLPTGLEALSGVGRPSHWLTKLRASGEL